MIVGVTFSEGEWPMALDISALDLPTIIATGEICVPAYMTWYGMVHFRNAPPVKLAAIFLGKNLIYDFKLNELGQCPIRYRPGYDDDSCTWVCN